MRLALDAGFRRQHQHADVARPPILAKRPDHREPVHARHVEVAHDHVGPFLERHLQPRQAVAGDAHGEAFELQKVLHDRRDGPAVFDNEHAAARRWFRGRWVGRRRRGPRLRHRSRLGDFRHRSRLGDNRARPRWDAAVHVVGVRHDAEHVIDRGEALRRFGDAVFEQRPHAGTPRRSPDLELRRSSGDHLAHLVVDRKHFVDRQPPPDTQPSALVAAFSHEPPPVRRKPRGAADPFDDIGAGNVKDRA